MLSPAKSKLIMLAFLLTVMSAAVPACDDAASNQAPQNSDESTSIGTPTESETVEAPDTDTKVKSALRNAAVAQESYLNDYHTYTANVDDLSQRHWSAPGITLTIASAGKYSYCMQATDDASGVTWSLNSDDGLTRAGANC